MFMIIGKGSFTKENLINKLSEWGIIDPSPIVAEAERRGSAFIGNYKIFMVK